MNNLRILLYVIALSLTACHPNGTDVQQGLHKAAQVMEQDPDTALIILENIPLNRMNDAQRAEYNLLCTQADEDKNIPHLSDKKIRQAVSYFNTHGNEYQKSRSYYYLACVENDLGQIKAAEAHFKKAIKLAAFTKEYGFIAQVYKRCSVYYQTQGNFDGALEMERKAFANQLIRNDNDTHSGTIFSAALDIVGIMSLLLGILWKKNQHVHLQLHTFKEEFQKKDTESDKLTLQCRYLKEKHKSLQRYIYENSPVILKVGHLKERTALSPKVPFSEKDWSELLRLQENTYGLVSKLKEISPKLSEEDLKVCAFLREGVQPAGFADLMESQSNPPSVSGIVRNLFPVPKNYKLAIRQVHHSTCWSEICSPS